MQNGELMGWVLMDELLLLLAAPPISLDILMPDVSLHLFSLNMYENSFVLVFIKSSSTVQQLCVMESERDTQREEEEGGRQFLQVLFFFLRCTITSMSNLVEESNHACLQCS